ncbi:hypothetical protein KGF54_003670 [Candida jiufengensis]|uniref:uncharacterized protein n=1 Tax=Candida jiufengensis TaxID=497108 RepID=UPI0022247177|nr:uncharacterized protein KGF54_003670 [Candida jiufengensis]KAI5952803.1 hypothetical protein KGF54_003670 [Candida jiufengensis]
MVDFPSLQHKQLFKENRHNQTNGNVDSEERPLKRRKKESPEVIVISDESEVHEVNEIDENSDDSDDFEDVNLSAQENKVETNKIHNSDDDSDDFEDVEFDVSNASYDLNQPKPVQDDILSIQIQSKDEESPQKKKKVKFVTNEERHRRVLIHKLYLIMLIVHGTIRSSWCNDKEIGKHLKNACVTPQISELLKDDNSSDMVRSRRLLDGLKKLMTIYLSKYRITSQGLIRKNWKELEIVQDAAEVVTKKKFKKLVTNFRGSRDVAAQGFVALLRALGLNARLVLSLQPPDYTLITENDTNEDKGHGRKLSLEDSNYPIFWIEVWDKFGKKWISIDPIVLKSIEVCPKRKKSAFEPPSTDERNQLLYAIAFDKFGRVRDVTRRYSFNYNARTIRKRIEFRSSDDKEWYYSILTSCEKKKSKSVPDIYESKEFHERDLAEGMPNNIQAFKDHPLYALESQLRQNEVIHPKDRSSVYGMFRPKNHSTKLIEVYKRSNVYRLRSARAWYMRGRVLKIGAVALKAKKGNNIEEGEDVRLYAEFQTKLFIPLRIEQGKIPKNQYGNIDIYTKTMIPENGSLIEVNDSVNMKLLIRCATLLGIDFAKAITSFDFKQKGRHAPNAKEGGIVVLKDHEEAMRITIQHLLEEKEEQRRLMVEINALQNWRYFLLKLRLNQRLNRTHGKIDGEVDDDEDEDVELVGNEFAENEEAEYEDGGFMADSAPVYSGQNISDDEDDDDGFGGGFIVSDNEEVGSEVNEDKIEIEDTDTKSKREARRTRTTSPKYTDEQFEVVVDDDDDDEMKSKNQIIYSDSSGSEAEYVDDENVEEGKDDEEEEGLEFDYESE